MHHSDKETTENTDVEEPSIYPKFSWQVKTVRTYYHLLDLVPVEMITMLHTTEKQITLPTRMKISFKLNTIRPKVQKIRLVPLGQIPRDVETERKRKYYASINFAELLIERNIDNQTLFPVEIVKKIFPERFSPETIIRRKYYLPLQWFDNRDFDIYTEKDWLKLGRPENEQYPLPGLAFLPNLPFLNEDQILIENIADAIKSYMSKMTETELEQYQTQIYVWRYVAIWDYNEKLDKWIVTDLDTYKSYRIDRIYLKFIAENPHVYVDRLQYALNNRDKSEYEFKLETVLDMLTYVSDMEPLSNRLQDLIKTKLNYKGDTTEAFQILMRKQVNINYQRLMRKYEFEHFLIKHPREYSYLSIIEKEQKFYKSMVAHSYINIKNLVTILEFKTVFFIPETIYAMSAVTYECLKTETMSLYQFSIGKTVALVDFRLTQTIAVSTAFKFFREFWIDTIAGKLTMGLRGVGKGWVDVKINDWSVFKYMKMYKFLHIIKLRMESTLQDFLIKSINSFVTLICVPCYGYLDILKLENINEYEWTNDFLTNPYEQYGPPVFYIEFDLSPDGVLYSTNPDDFLITLLDIYNTSITQFAYINLVDSRVMSNLVFAKNLYLDCGFEIDDMYKENLKLLKDCITSVTIPLIAYSKKYEQFIELYCMDFPLYVKHLEKLNLSAIELKELINEAKRKRDEIEEILPKTINIGVYFINNLPLKSTLLTKQDKLIDVLFDYFVDRMDDINSEILDRYNDIFNRLKDKPQSVEHLFDMKDFIEIVPDLVSNLDDRVKIMITEYEILDYFQNGVNNEQFGKKWEAFGYSHRIHLKINQVNEQFPKDFEQFQKLQLSEYVVFQESMDFYKEEIVEFANHIDPENTLEIVIEARKLQNTLMDAKKTGLLLQKRQILFELDEISLDVIDEIIESYQPFYKMWTNCERFLLLEEAIYTQPLSGLDVQEIKAAIGEILVNLEECKEKFRKKIDLANVAIHFENKITEFKPAMEVIECVRNPNWLNNHWIELSEKSEVEIKYSPIINFYFCVKKGILTAIPIVKEIFENAIAEAEEARKELEEKERLRIEEEAKILARKACRRCRLDIF